MFERFTESARLAVTGAQAEARELGAPFIGTEHLLIAVLAGGDAAARTLGEHGLAAADLRARLAAMGRTPLDAEALKSIGIDLDAVREATEQSFGEGALDSPADSRRAGRGHIPFTPRAKKSLELSLRHAIRLKQKHIASGHILLGVLHDKEFMAVRLVTEAGVDAGDLRAGIERLLIFEAA
jgi:ATP-dependent Clp protease ATP-binding subunit ClpA